MFGLYSNHTYKGIPDETINYLLLYKIESKCFMEQITKDYMSCDHFHRMAL